MLGFLAKATLHSKVIVKAASVLQIKFLAKATRQSEIPFKMHGEDKICQAMTSENPANLAKLGRVQNFYQIYAALPNF